MTATAGTVLNGRYRLIRTVGIGSQASVWVAEHLALSTQVAVKLIDPELAKRPDARERFKREATAAAQLRSPHVVQILDHGIDGDQPFIVMELLDGEDLFQRLEKRHHLSIKDTSKIMTQVARALTRAHAAGIVHRDLKPENVFLTHNEDDEIVKVLDFGVAKVLDSAKATMQKTGVGTLIGTPHYMSPEQVKGIGEVDYRTDIWAMGVLAYQCVTGELPFESEGVGDLLIKITIGEMPVPSRALLGVPTAFDGWFARACDRDASRRFASARAAAEGLARIAGLSTSSAGPTSVPRPGASIPPPVDPTKRVSEVPPQPKTAAKSSPSLKPSAPPPEELDDEDWEIAEPAVTMEPPPGSEDETEAMPAIPKAVLAKPPGPPPRGDVPPPPPSRPSVPGGPPSRPSAGAAPVAAPPAAPVAAPPAAPAAAPAPPPPSASGPVNPFLVNDFVAPPAAAPPAPVSRPSAPRPVAPQPPPPQPYVGVPRSTVSGVESPDIEEELEFGKNRRKKLVRWLTVGLVLLVAGVAWMVVSSQLRGRAPLPDAATAPPAASSAPPPVVTSFDPVPDPSASTSATGSASKAPTGRPSVAPRPTYAPGKVPTTRPKTHNDGSVEIPDDPDLPPPAP